MVLLVTLALEACAVLYIMYGDIFRPPSDPPLIPA